MKPIDGSHQVTPNRIKVASAKLKSKKFQTPERLSICFVSETGRVENPLLDPSVRYRCYHPAEALLDSGHRCTVISAASFFENPPLRHDVYIFHRPNIARPNFAREIDTLKKSGAILVADYDDLIFGNADLALVSSAVKNGTLTESKAISAFRSNLAALLHFDKVTASTKPLIDRIHEFNAAATCFHVPNVIPESILSLHRLNKTHFLKRPSTTIGYFAGTKSHDKDFPIVEEVLHRILCENTSLNLLVVGPVRIPRSLAMLPNVRTAPVVNFLRLPSLMSMCATVIAPLESSAFNACKSRVKFLEAALGGCRLIATPIPDMVEIGSNHVSFADTHDEWYEALSTPLTQNDRSDLAARNFGFLEDNPTNTAIHILAEKA